jgi:hypothetical protein
MRILTFWFSLYVRLWSDLSNFFLYIHENFEILVFFACSTSIGSQHLFYKHCFLKSVTQEHKMQALANIAFTYGRAAQSMCMWDFFDLSSLPLRHVTLGFCNSADMLTERALLRLQYSSWLCDPWMLLLVF